ncbi:MAG: (deoxy)nucleoside triphosphate pyrophosphohydrolase [Christensenellaceae bacterium]
MNLTTYVAAALILRGDRILIAQRETLLWEFPGGKIETGEDPRDTVRRELQEELGLQVEVGPVFDVIHHAYPQRTVTMLLYLCGLPGGQVPRCLDGPVDVQWVTPDQLRPDGFLAADRPLIAAIQKRPQQFMTKAAVLWGGYRPQEEEA